MLVRKILLIIGVVLIATLLTISSIAAKAEVEVSPEQLAQLEANLADDSKDLPVGEEFRISVEPGDLSIVQGLDGDWLNILLLGTDSGDLRLNFGRTDAMMVLSVHRKTGELKLTSLVRDMYVDIPGMKLKNRINTANAFGGPLLAVKNVNEVLGLNIEGYVSINFTGFRDIVDELGGVRILLSNAEAAQAGVRYSNEPQLLNGEQALHYVRIRNLDNNFGRNERQRKFLTAILEQVKASSFDQIMDAITAGFRSVATNLSTGEVVALLPSVLKNTTQMETLSLPEEGQYKLRTTEAGASVVEFDGEETKASFHRFVYGGE